VDDSWGSENPLNGAPRSTAPGRRKAAAATADNPPGAFATKSYTVSHTVPAPTAPTQVWFEVWI
jgi:hypothetical protein